MTRYSAAQKFLHHAALRWRMMGEVAFDLERTIFLGQAPSLEPGRHVFVAGLARSGSTILLRSLHMSGEFASLLYADAPFVLCPNLWQRGAKLFSRRVEPHERAHGDGIIIDDSSPEALDEVFWRLFDGSRYIADDRLLPHAPSPDLLDKFGEYMRLIMLARGRERYLSKNNNNVLRVASLRRTLPRAWFLLPVREPLSHAFSLLEQHRRFGATDRFAQNYMTWLGHHEFGATHRPFVFDGESRPAGDLSSLDYWLERWRDCYRYLYQLVRQDGDRLCFVPYASLCLDTRWRERLFHHLGVAEPKADTFRYRQHDTVSSLNPALTRECAELYEAIVELAARETFRDAQASDYPRRDTEQHCFFAARDRTVQCADAVPHRRAAT